MEFASGVDSARDKARRLTKQHWRELRSGSALLLELCALDQLTIEQITGVSNLTQGG